MRKNDASLKKCSILFDRVSTEKRPNIQVYPGARTRQDVAMLHGKRYVSKLNSNDGEVFLILILVGLNACSIPVVVVPEFENVPFWISLDLSRHDSSIEAFVQRRSAGLSCDFVCSTISCKCCVGKPVADHDFSVAECKLIKPVYDSLCASRQYVGIFESNHNCCGFKLNIFGDRMSPMQLQPSNIGMSEIKYDDSVAAFSIKTIQIEVSKCQQSFSTSPKIHPLKCRSNHVANHASNHDGAFVIPAHSIGYECLTQTANHATNRDSNHDRAKKKHFLSSLTTQVTAMNNCVISAISIRYKRFGRLTNHASNHVYPKKGDSKMKPSTTSNHGEVYCKLRNHNDLCKCHFAT